MPPPSLYSRISHRLPVSLLAQSFFVLLAFFLMTSISYFAVRGILNKHLLSAAEESLRTTEAHIEATLQEQKNTLINSALIIRRIIKRGGGQEQLLAYMTELTDWLKTNRGDAAGFNGIYAFLRGDFLSGARWQAPAVYDPTERPWYRAAKEAAGQVAATDIYIDAHTGDAIVSYAQELFDDDGASLGVLAIDARLDKILGYIKSVKLFNSDRGFCVLLNRSLRFVNHPNAAFIDAPFASVNDRYADVARRLRAGENISAWRAKNYAGVASVVFFHRIFNGWYLGVIEPEDDYRRDLTDTLWALTTMGALMSVALIFGLQRLRRRINNLINELRVTANRMQEASRLKSDFLANVSHEFRTPLNAVHGFAALAMRDDDVRPVCRHYFEKISLAVRSLLVIIDDLLDLTAIEQGKITLTVAPFDLRELLENTLTIHENAAAAKGLTLAAEFIPPPPHLSQIVRTDLRFGKMTLNLTGDASRLAQVLNHLVSNAIKFTERGDVAVRAHTLDENPRGVLTKIEVIDTGVGIKPSMRNNIFAHFSQGDSSSTRRFGGLGIGLANCKRLLELMDGKLTVRSEVGRGSVFTVAVRLPRGERAAPPPEPTEEDFAALNLAGKTILIVDDNLVNQALLEQLIAPTQCETLLAGDGQEAVKTAQTRHLDLIFMDLQMPVMDGLQATRVIRETFGTLDLPIIAVSANAMPEHKQAGLAAGMNDYLTKPVDIIELYNALKNYVG
ncbi:MAG: response regulator [Planctomycetota bacterium]|jgi:signal transduction histidine kinase/CheY-like chemotaxis protein|nr:response regulator [Planctomycetota bacterium]